MATIQTTAIKATSRIYSTSEAPSSSRMNCVIMRVNVFNIRSHLLSQQRSRQIVRSRLTHQSSDSFFGCPRESSYGGEDLSISFRQKAAAGTSCECSRGGL